MNKYTLFGIILLALAFLALGALLVQRPIDSQIQALELQKRSLQLTKIANEYERNEQNSAFYSNLNAERAIAMQIPIIISSALIMIGVPIIGLIAVAFTIWQRHRRGEIYQPDEAGRYPIIRIALPNGAIAFHDPNRQLQASVGYNGEMNLDLPAPSYEQAVIALAALAGSANNLNRDMTTKPLPAQPPLQRPQQIIEVLPNEIEWLDEVRAELALTAGEGP